MPHPKTRGFSRHYSNFARRMDALTRCFPEPHEGRCYWHFHLPISQRFINSPRTPNRVRRECVQKLLDAASKLIALRASSVAAPIVVAVSMPHIFDSQLIAFFSSDYYTSFFDRHTPDQQWTALPASRSLAHEWRLSLPPKFSERGFHEYIHDEDYQQHGEIWFFGELS